MYNKDSSKEAGHHYKNTNCEIKLHKQLSKACVNQGGMSKM